MDLPFLQELTETRLFRDAIYFKGKSAEQLAELVIMLILTLEILRHVSPRSAAEYAEKTMRFQDFDRLRLSVTDLHNLIVVLHNQKDYEHLINANPNITIPFMQLRQYFRDMANGRELTTHDEYFLIRLEDYLKVSNFKSIRRIITNWDKEPESAKYNTLCRLRQEFSNKGYQLDLWTDYREKLSI